MTTAQKLLTTLDRAISPEFAALEKEIKRVGGHVAAYNICAKANVRFQGSKRMNAPNILKALKSAPTARTQADDDIDRELRLLETRCGGFYKAADIAQRAGALTPSERHAALTAHLDAGDKPRAAIAVVPAPIVPPRVAPRAVAVPSLLAEYLDNPRTTNQAGLLQQDCHYLDRLAGEGTAAKILAKAGGDTYNQRRATLGALDNARQAKANANQGADEYRPTASALTLGEMKFLVSSILGESASYKVGLGSTPEEAYNIALSHFAAHGFDDVGGVSLHGTKAAYRTEMHPDTKQLAIKSISEFARARRGGTPPSAMGCVGQKWSDKLDRNIAHKAKFGF